MIHYGDIRNLSGKRLPVVDIITGGSPCQDLSIAGKRSGIKGEQSGLFMDQIRIIREMRDLTDGASPRFMVWENVPGALSSNKGEDFRIVLSETVRITDPTAVIPGSEKWAPSGCVLGDGWSIAWRIHDAKFWGVPQHRKRIALVADFTGGSAPEILFERKSLQRRAQEGREEKGASANDNGKGFNKASAPMIFDARGNGDGETATTLTGDHERRITDYTNIICINGDIAGTLDANYFKGCGSRGDIEREIILACDGVRRLTPTECERLQGYPDGWTDIGDWTDDKGRKRKTTDSARYKVLGNSLALPFWEWMAARIISRLNKAAPTMGSLFDGIGGFPLVFSRNRCLPLWASEVDDFAIAVTKSRFP